jgi:DHA2 family methylenomycin A resistance protein-like MFS transporter
VGLAAGPVVGGLLTSGPGWRWIFLVNLPVGVLAMAAAQRVVRETVPAKDRALDLTGQFLAVVLLWSLTYAVIEAGRPGHALRAVLAGLAALPLTWLLVRAERRAPSPMVDLELMRSRRLLAALFGAFAANFAYFGGLFVVSFYLQHQLGLSPTGAGLRFLPMTAAIVVMGPVAGRVSSRWGTRIPSTAGLATTAVGFTGAAGLGPATSYSVIAFWIAVIGLGAGLAITPLISAVVTAVPAHRAGMGSAIANTARNTGGVLGVAVLGALALNGEGPAGQRAAFLVAAGVLTLAAVRFWTGTGESR